MKAKKFDIAQNINYSLGILCLAALALVLTVYAFRNVAGFDIWLHLKSGQLILQNKAVFFTDPFSFTLANRPWIDHSWLFQVIAYIFYNQFSWQGLFWLQATVACSILLLFIFTIYKKDNIFLTALGSLFIVFLLLPRFITRPDIFSFLFFAYYLFILTKFRNSKLIYTLIPAQILWVNIHGYFILGLVLVLAFWLDDWLANKRFKKDKSCEPLKRFSNTFLLLLACCFISPYTYRSAIYPFSVLINSIGTNKIFFSKIQELKPGLELKTIFDIEQAAYFKVLAFISALSFFLNYSKIKIRDVILWLFFLAMAILSVRHMVYFAIFSSLIMVQNLEEFVKVQDFLHIKYKKLKMVLHYIMRVFFIIFVASTIKPLLSGKVFSFAEMEFKKKVGDVSSWVYPKKGADFILKNNFPARMFNNFNSGAYIIGNCYPKRKVFIDGRTEFYGAEFFSKYEKALKGDQQAVDEAIEKYGLEGFFISFALSGIPEELLRYLYDSKKWVPVFLDESAIVFLMNSRANRDLIRKFRLNFKNWQPPEFEFAEYGSEAIYPLPFIQRGKVFKALKLYDAQIKEATAAIEGYPTADAYNLRAEGYFEKGNYAEAFDDFRSAVLLRPNNPALITGLGKAYLKMGKLELAKLELKKALEINPEFAPAYYNLGLLFIEENDLAAAKRSFELAVKYDPENKEYSEKLN